MNCWVSLCIQEYHRKGHLITEQVPGHNLLFELITTTVPNKVISEVVAEGRHKPRETNNLNNIGKHNIHTNELYYIFQCL
jgi:hypothetical protein